jgi:hypothetical protein
MEVTVVAVRSVVRSLCAGVHRRQTDTGRAEAVPARLPAILHRHRGQQCRHRLSRPRQLSPGRHTVLLQQRTALRSVPT